MMKWNDDDGRWNGDRDIAAVKQSSTRFLWQEGWESGKYGTAFTYHTNT